MSSIIYVTGNGTFAKANKSHLAVIKEIRNIWDSPAFTVSSDGKKFEFSLEKMDGLTPYKDGVLDPLNELIEYADRENIRVDGIFKVTSDNYDYDNIAVLISNNMMSTANSEIVSASTDELEEELRRREKASERKTKMDTENRFDVVLLEKPMEDGLTKDEILKMYDILSGTEGYPIEHWGSGASVAMGFITPNASEELHGEYEHNSALGAFIASILDDMNKETEDGVYEFKGLRIWMRRDMA